MIYKDALETIDEWIHDYNGLDSSQEPEDLIDNIRHFINKTLTTVKISGSEGNWEVNLNGDVVSQTVNRGELRVWKFDIREYFKTYPNTPLDYNIDILDIGGIYLDNTRFEPIARRRPNGYKCRG